MIPASKPSRVVTVVVATVCATGVCTAAACGRVETPTDGPIANASGGRSSRDSGASPAATGGAIETGGRSARGPGGSGVGGFLATGGRANTGGAAGSGGVSNSGGTPGSGGSADASIGFGGSFDVAPACTPDVTACPQMTGSNPLTSCCAASNECGFDTAPLRSYRDVAGGCHALGEPGMVSSNCSSGHPDTTCCRFDGTCGTDLSLMGLGCVEPTSEAGAGRPCKLTGACRIVIEATTVSKNGRFEPANVGAIWIETTAGQFVKTLTTWGTIMLSQVVTWYGASGGNRVDAVSGATRRVHGPVQAVWNCTDAQEARVPEGRYLVCMSYADQAAPFFSDAALEPAHCVAFDHGPEPLDQSGAPGGGFGDIRIVSE